MIDEVLADLPDVEVLGPVEIDPDGPGDGRAEGGTRERALLRVARADGRSLAKALHAAQATRTARKTPDPVRVRLDPTEIG
jgi:primosomal protein N' (replication factor Y)